MKGGQYVIPCAGLSEMSTAKETLAMIRRRNAALFLVVATAAFCKSASAQIVATYQFNNSFAADQAGAPAITPVNSGFFQTDTPFGMSRTVYYRSAATNV